MAHWSAARHGSVFLAVDWVNLAVDWVKVLRAAADELPRKRTGEQLQESEDHG